MTEAEATSLDPERQRQNEGLKWMVWGPFLSERQWGTVREDYSPDGEAWDYFPHQHAHSRAYRWGEDGIAGFSDYRSRICVAVALWNGRDPILKERLFGLTNSEGNHGEDVKELYYYLDATPTHSYLRMLYKYPHAAFPYEQLLAENGRRSRAEREYELIDTGTFDQDRYFDVVIEYAKAAPDDIRMRVTVHNRGPEAADIHVLPHLWFRNTWSWESGAPKPELTLERPGTIRVEHPELGSFRFDTDATDIYFCDNETNAARVFGTNPAPGYFKDAIHERVVGGKHGAVNPEQRGTKAAAHYRFSVPPGGQVQVHGRLRGSGHERGINDNNAIVERRRADADQFYEVLQEGIADVDQRLVQRQALAGMIWSKQFYNYDIRRWLSGDPVNPPPPPERASAAGRNTDWRHLNNAEVISMPDKWEYPWYAAWDLAFHALPLAMVDAGFAKRQLLLMTREWYMHPNGQLPAYEWKLGDVNPPVHAWASWRVFQIDRKQRGDAGDLRFLERVFHKLVINFTWWVNRKDASGHNVFQGGFLGLDNIGLFDRSAPLPPGWQISQSDGTSWMAMYSLNLMRMALELAQHNDTYEDIASKFFEHFLHIAGAMATAGDAGLWDEEDAFYYDWLEMSDPRRRMPLRVRSMVGLIPLFAVEVLEADVLDRLPGFRKRMEWFLNSRKDLHDLVSHWEVPGQGQRRLLSLLRGRRMKALLRRMLDEKEFLSPYGVRALSRAHLDHPVHLENGAQKFTVGYTPGESDTALFGGNSNWRGPVWMPVNYLLIESLQKFHHYYGPEFTIECPVGSGQKMTLLEASEEVSRRILRLFARDESGRRPMFGDVEKFQSDPHFRDNLIFPEYFHGDTGRGVGASHQTGWTGLIAKLIQPRRTR